MVNKNEFPGLEEASMDYISHDIIEKGSEFDGGRVHLLLQFKESKEYGWCTWNGYIGEFDQEPQEIFGEHVKDLTYLFPLHKESIRKSCLDE